MNYRLHPRFKKQLKKFKKSEQAQFYERLRLFLHDPRQPALRNHPLIGEYQGCWSINITGDIRAIYYLINRDTAMFVEVDTHSQLYR